MCRVGTMERKDVAVPRDRRIVEEVLRTGGCSVDGLAAHFSVSTATIRRDLAELERQGLLRRTRGGAAPIEPIHSDLFLHDTSFQEQMRLQTAEKRRIALAAAERIEDGDTIALSTGTTTALVARSIRHRRDITVVTSTLNVALELCKRDGLSVFVTGGHMRGSWFSMGGATALDAIHSINLDKAFLGVHGIDPARGLTANNDEDAAVNRAMMDQARTKIALADHSKFGKVAKNFICPAAEVDLIITDTCTRAVDIGPYQAMGIGVQRV